MITLTVTPYGYDLTDDHGYEEFILSDWDYPSTAQRFGWVPCTMCNNTDGTVDCPHRTHTEMIQSAQMFLDEHDNDTVPGYLN